MKKITLIQTFILLTAFANAADYNYNVQMKESDGSVHDMGDVHIKVNQDNQAAPGAPKLVTTENNANAQLLAKIQDYIKSNYKNYNVTVRIIGGVVQLNGNVNSRQDQKSIEDAILKIDGVKKVDNQIKIGS